MAAQDYTVYLKKNVKFTMKDVASETKEDVSLQVQRTYRDGTLDSGIAIDLTASVPGAGVYTIPPATPVGGATPQYIPPLLNTDEYQHTAPRDEAVKRSRYIWKNAGADVLGWAWCDQILSISTGQPTRI